MATRRHVVGLVSVLCLVGAVRPAAGAVTVEDVLQAAGAPRGVAVVLGDGQCRLALELARKSELTVFVPLADPAAVRAAREAADAAGMYGSRIFVAQGAPGRIGLAENVADVLAVAAGDAPPKAEALRVLRPGGKALLGGEQWVKPVPDGADAWSHSYHGPDNNAQSDDRLARAPYLTQFVSQPRYGPAPQSAVAAGGRIFMAFGHVAWHQREEPWMNTLVALNGYNGTVLWKRALPKGIMVDRNTMIATPETLYLADHESCKLIDPATGEVRGEIAPPADATGGTFWKWMALDGGVLYALVGPAEPMDDDARWRRTAHGWPWGGISKGYNDNQYAWGFAPTLLAIDPATKKVLWQHKSDRPMDSRMLCMKAGRIFIGSFGHFLACLDARTGKALWQKDASSDGDYFQAMGKFSPGHGYRTGWKSTTYARCTDKALYLMGPQLDTLTAVSAEDGYALWSLPAKINVHVIVRPEGLYTIGAQNTKGETRKLDPMTGKVLATYDVWRRACTRATGSPDGILFRASGGTARLDAETGKVQCISPMRPSCTVGVVIAHGQLYWLPWVCDCNLQMFGAICLGPAGDFRFDAPATDAERLETLDEQTQAERRAAAAKQKKPGPGPSDRRRQVDWATYLGNNARMAQTAWPPLQAPEEAALLWEHKPQRPCEPTAPVLVGGLAYLAGRDGVVRALRMGDGKEAWRAYTGGAVFFPPTIAANGRAFVGSADGWAYCFDAANGTRLWRFRAAPAERSIGVFGRLQSTWPVASGVLVEDGVAYFAAGMTDYDGTHVYAVDARTGKLKWHNGTSGHLDAFSRRGVAVQGHLLSHDGKLYLAGGNCVSPAAYDMKTGKCLSPPPEGFGTRGPRGRELRLVGGSVQVSGQPLYSEPESPVFDQSARWAMPVIAGGNANVLFLPPKGGKASTWSLVAVDPFRNEQMWSQSLPCAPVRWGLAGGGGRIVVTLRDGRVLCFGPAPAKAVAGRP
ncbi:MAG TPA: PQQ-binding-like beta-propeller repeat protein [Phycisphaerae bacterium]|nr:PQQ-binding-like beta-propeller repeat protein [Phycisphaerae bacterium]